MLLVNNALTEVRALMKPKLFMEEGPVLSVLPHNALPVFVWLCVGRNFWNAYQLLLWGIYYIGVRNDTEIQRLNNTHCKDSGHNIWGSNNPSPHFTEKTPKSCFRMTSFSTFMPNNGNWPNIIQVTDIPSQTAAIHYLFQHVNLNKKSV